MKRGSVTPSEALIGIAELHDLSLEAQIAPLLRLLSAEEELVPDLCRARPWLTERSGQRVLELLLEQEWSGFVARLGRCGPWVYAPSVADLQALSGAYTRLVRSVDSRQTVPHTQPEGQSLPWLTLRLRAGGQKIGNEVIGGEVSGHAELETAFWKLAQETAERQRQMWAARRQRG